MSSPDDNIAAPNVLMLDLVNGKVILCMTREYTPEEEFMLFDSKEERDEETSIVAINPRAIHLKMIDEERANVALLPYGNGVEVSLYPEHIVSSCSAPSAYIERYLKETVGKVAASCLPPGEHLSS